MENDVGVPHLFVGHADFEKPAGPIGTDDHGHVVEVDDPKDAGTEVVEEVVEVEDKDASKDKKEEKK